SHVLATPYLGGEGYSPKRKVLLRVTYRNSLFGSPRANALNQTCSSGVTY
ncbi:hypothetical protein T484DRAFT_1882350, partial [Baffinella frigidus]